MRVVGRCLVIEILLTVGLVVFALFVVGAVIFHILVGLVLLPVKLAFVVLKGTLFALFAIPLAVMAASLALGALSIVLALGAVARVCAALF
jgi:hypothetical protein